MSTKGHIAAQKDFASRLQLMRHEAGQLGLYSTMNRMDFPIRMVGFEIADDIDGCLRYEEAVENKQTPRAGAGLRGEGKERE